MMTFLEFLEEINDLPNHFKNRNLETYLLAIYKILDDNKEIYAKEQASLESVLCILKEAFTSTPASFDKEWLSITTSPNSNSLSRKFTTPGLKNVVDKTNQATSIGMEFTMDVLRFQISELHKMKNKQLKDDYRYLGINSETGHRWYNFDPFTNLECGVRCMGDTEEDNSVIDWSFIGNLLEDGRVYE